MHLFVDISGHGLGHLAITAPVLHALAESGPLHLTVRSGIPEAHLRERIRLPFHLIPAASDFGFVMVDALQVDREASAAAYRAAHADWPARVAAEADFLRRLAPDQVLSNVSYLPLAGAAQAGLPAVALCSLNWADLFAHFFAHEDWAAPIHAQMLAAYRGARTFVCTTPGMAMPALPHRVAVGPIARLGPASSRHSARNLIPDDLNQAGRATQTSRRVLLAMGGITHFLPVDRWPRVPGVRWLIPADWPLQHPDAEPFDRQGLDFTALLCSVDAVITKPGYGTFTEAACNSIPVLYQRREDWPEQDCLIEWLQRYGMCQEISGEALACGDVTSALESLWALPRPVPPSPTGAQEAADFLRALS